MKLTDPVAGEKVPVFNPRRDNWAEHCAWESGGIYIIGLTPCGRAMVDGLHLNDIYHVTARRTWILARKYPPK